MNINIIIIIYIYICIYIYIYVCVCVMYAIWLHQDIYGYTLIEHMPRPMFLQVCKRIHLDMCMCSVCVFVSVETRCRVALVWPSETPGPVDPIEERVRHWCRPSACGPAHTQTDVHDWRGGRDAKVPTVARAGGLKPRDQIP